MQKQLTKINETYWVDLSHVTGVKKVEKGFRLLLGHNGAEVQQTFKKRDLRRWLKIAGLAGF